MMSGNLSGRSLSTTMPYAVAIEEACLTVMSPPLAYAIAQHESIEGELNGKWIAHEVVSDDGGHGLFQLTSSYPDDWIEPSANARYAVAHFLEPAYEFWSTYYHLEGGDLVRAIAAEFNAGRSAALAGHHAGNVDLYTTDHYAEAVLAIYTRLVQSPEVVEHADDG
jgi:hypothetical protein